MSLKQNIIYIYFKGKHQVTSKSQYQYNRGQYLYFADLNLPQAFEVHFSNKDKGESKTQIGNDNLVEIPDEYFWNGALQIYAWIYLHSETTDGETIYEVRIPLTKRAKPTDEEPLPVQQSTIDRAIAELNNAVDITTENANKTDSDKIIVSNIKEDAITLKDEIDSTATTINQKAQETINASERAETSAQNAATSENKALNYSQQAEQSAQSALESKNITQQKSEIATNASNEALGYRNEALEAKNQAVQAKQNIVDYRDETKGFRDETLNLKNTVQTLKNQIDETAEEIEDISDSVKKDAQSASQSASSASQSANSASQSADSASQSANQAEQYKNQSATNVTHYPKVVDGYWYVWDASNAEYVNTNVDARGIKGDKGDTGETGVGIESTVLNSDYTLTITFTDDTSYTTPSIRGEKGIKGDIGNGIASTVLNNDYTLTINFTDGTTYTTPSIRGEKGQTGDTPTITASKTGKTTSIYVDGSEVAQIEDGTDGTNGDDGYSLTANVTKSGKVATITITDQNGTTSAQVEDGTDGTDGVSPTVTITPITGGHRITITDADGEHSADIMDGDDYTLTEQDKQDIADIAEADLTPTILNAFPTDIASGSIASFPDGADDLPLKSLVVNIDPVQDLHGQDAPWPAGGGKNLIIPPKYTAATPTLCLDLGTDTKFSAITLQFKATNAVALYNNAAIIDFRKDDETRQYVTLAEFYNENGVRFTPNTVLNGTFSSTKTNITFRQVYIYYEQNSYAKFQTDCLSEWQLAVGSTATSYAPYENICPISGWNGVKVTRTGKNLWNPVPNGMAKWNPSIGEQIPSLTTNFTTFENDVLSVNTNWAWNGNAFITNKLLTGRTYRVTGVVNSNSNRARIGVYTLDANRRVVRIIRYVTDNGNMDVSVTMGASDVYICVLAANATDNEAVTITNPCISESGVYEPYTGRSITIDLGQTVYGAKLYPLEGKALITMAMVDLSMRSWLNASTGTSGINRFACYVEDLDIKLPSANNVRANMICDRYATETADGTYLKRQGIAINASNKCIFVFDPRYNDVTDFKASFEHLYLCYELAEPIEIQLSANQINSLYGANNIFADTGDCSVEYRADTKLYIERLTAPDSADMIADANITSGQYFMVGNSLYKATANIANGSAIVVGTNCTRKSLSEALNEINA